MQRILPRLPLLGLAVLLPACIVTIEGPEPDAQRQLTLLAGQRDVDEGVWDAADELDLVGVEFVDGGHGHSLGYEVALLHTRGDEAGVDVGYDALALGLRRTTSLSDVPVHPFAALGVTVMRVREEIGGSAGDEDGDLDGGLYLSLGADWWLGPHFALGIGIRIVRQELLDFGGRDLDGDALTARLSIGF